MATMNPGALVPAQSGEWTCRRMALDHADRLDVRFDSAGGDWLEVTVEPAAAAGKWFKRLDHCNVRYRGEVAARTEHARLIAQDLVIGVGRFVDERMGARPGTTIAEALGRRPGPGGPVAFGRETLAAMLAPELVVGETRDGWTFNDIYPSSHMQQQSTDELQLIAEFARDSGERMRLLVARKTDGASRMADSAHLAVSYLTGGRDAPAGGEDLAARVAFLLQLRDHDGVDLQFPDVASDVAEHLLAPGEPAAATSEAWLNLAIDTECHQQCAFCSIKRVQPAVDPSPRLAARLRADLRSNRDAGVHRLRLNGYDPLTYPGVVDLLADARDLGYDEVTVFSPCTVLADRALCESVIAALPEAHRIVIPLYGASAGAHDAVVGRPGAFALVTEAIGNLLDTSGADRMRITTVLTQTGADQLAAIAAYAKGIGVELYAQLPYPTTESSTDAYHAAAPSFARAAAVLAAIYRDEPTADGLEIRGLVPCYTLRAMRRAGVAPRRWLRVTAARRSLPGTEYGERDTRHRATAADHAAFEASAIACPVAGQCALREACPGRILRSYVERFGIADLAAVSLAELIEAT